MAIIVKEEEPFEVGTTVSSRIVLKDEGDNVIQADTVNGTEDVTLEVKNSDGGAIVRAEETMDALDDDNGDRFYLDTWITEEDAEPGEYYLVHRATVNSEPYKLTKIIELVEVKDDC